MIQNSAEFAGLKTRCQELEDTFDFSREILILRHQGGDCRAWFEHDIHLDSARKKLVWVVYNHYGGCRAWGGRTFFFVLPKPPEGYTLEMRTILVEQDGSILEKE